MLVAPQGSQVPAGIGSGIEVGPGAAEIGAGMDSGAETGSGAGAGAGAGTGPWNLGCRIDRPSYCVTAESPVRWCPVTVGREGKPRHIGR